MAEHQLGNKDVAEKALSQAEQQLEQHRPKSLAKDGYGSQWHNLLSAEALYAEAEETAKE